MGLKNTTTGDTLCDEKAPVILESMDFPEPVIRVAIEPKTKAGQEKMGLALVKLAEEDPTFKTYTDEETGQTIIAGMGELHLEIIVDRLLREFKVEANVGAPQVAYKETVRKKVDQETKYKRQSGGSGQYGHVKITWSPTSPARATSLSTPSWAAPSPRSSSPLSTPVSRVPCSPAWWPASPWWMSRSRCTTAPITRWTPLKWRSRSPAPWPSRRPCARPIPSLLEPIMKVSVIVPDEYLGTVIGDLTSRRGQIQGQEARPGAQQVDALVPLANMFGYATDLRSNTQGRGQYTMEPHSYAEIPKSIRDKIVEERGKKPTNSGLAFPGDIL